MRARLVVDREALRRDAARGLSPRELAKKYAISEGSARRYLRDDYLMELSAAPIQSNRQLARIGTPQLAHPVLVLPAPAKRVQRVTKMQPVKTRVGPVAAGWMSWRGDWWQWVCLALPVAWLGNAVADFVLAAAK